MTDSTFALFGLAALAWWLGTAYLVAHIAAGKGRHKVGWFIAGLASYAIFTIVGYVVCLVIVLMLESKKTTRGIAGGTTTKARDSQAAHPSAPHVVVIYSTLLNVADATRDALAQATARAEAEARNGLVLLEAVWQDQKQTRLGLAFGTPGGRYGRQWPSGGNIRNTILLHVAEAPVVQPEVPDVTPRPVVDAVAHDVDQPVGEPTKVCPDCAESVLDAARICRFCRYEFRPVAPRWLAAGS